MKELNFNEIKPFIRFAQTLNINSNGQFSNLKSYDYRCFYCYNGTGKINIDNNSYDMKAGSLIIWRPSLFYQLQKTDASFQLVGINFDFTNKNNHKNTPIPPSSTEKFKKNEIIEIIDFSDLKMFNSPVFLENINTVENRLFEMVTEYKSKKIFYQNIISGIFVDILSQIARMKITGINQDNNDIDIILKYIHKNYNQEISNKLLGDLFNYHPNYLNRLMVLHTGMSLHKYILNYRLNKAINLIQTTNLTISEICYSVGFNDFTHFSKYFKKKIGKSPSDFK